MTRLLHVRGDLRIISEPINASLYSAKAIVVVDFCIRDGVHRQPPVADIDGDSSSAIHILTASLKLSEKPEGCMLSSRRRGKRSPEAKIRRDHLPVSDKFPTQRLAKDITPSEAARDKY